MGAIANVEPQNKHELPLIKDQKVNVIKKELSGWWLAQDPETDEIGWIPADFVEAISSESEEETSFAVGIVNDGFDNLENTEFVTTHRYEAKDETELSFDRHCIVRVLKEHDNGWWKIKYNNQEGLAPVCYLKPYDEPIKSICQNMRENK